MTRRSPLLPILALLAALAGCSGGTAAPRAPDDAPDLVLVVVDTLRADHLSTYGYHRRTSPGLDLLARQGVVFDDVTAQSSWTLPSMASMLTGRHLFVNAQRLPDAVPSLAERLSAAGYETVAFVGNFAVSRAGGYARGFDRFINRDDTGGHTWDAFALERALDADLAANPPGDRPRFYYLHFLDPHWPYEPRREPRLDGEARIRDDVLRAWMDAARAGGPLRGRFDEARRSILADVDAYDREIVNVDAALTRILAKLGERERLVIVSSDHGEGLWDHEHHAKLVERDHEPAERTLREVFFRDHSYHMYEELLRTPLVAAGPGLDGGEVVGEPVENVDIFPTLLRAAGLPDDPTLDGRALQDVVAGTAAPRELLYAHSNEATVVRTAEGAKLVFPTDTGFYFGLDSRLFDLASDPYERDNRAERDRETLRDLIGHREQAAEAFDLYDREPIEVEGAGQLEALRELGYVGAGFGGGEEGGDERGATQGQGDH